MLSVMILGAGLALAQPGESPAELANWIDARLEASWRAKGRATTASPAAFYFAVGNSPDRVAESVGRGLLGVRLGCAQCHNHPFAKWKREHFWGLAAFFAGTGTAPGQVNDGFTTRITPP